MKLRLKSSIHVFNICKVGLNRSVNRMKAFVAGIQDICTIDYPGKISTLIFFAGCNLRCRYCFNSDFLEFSEKFLRDVEDVKDRVLRNQPLIDAIMFSGGEPLLQERPLINISVWAKDKGFSVGMETNGTKPRTLKKILNMKLLDFVAMDIKTYLEKYEDVVQVNTQIAKKVGKSVEILINSAVDHEFRTTFVPGLVDVDHIESISKMVGQDKWAWQRFRYDLGEILDKRLIGRDFSPEDFRRFESLSKQYKNVVLRC